MPFSLVVTLFLSVSPVLSGLVYSLYVEAR